MEITTPTRSEWTLFSELARLEGWRVPALELELFQGDLAHGAFVLRAEEMPRGFVTAVAHERSGWIGNLIVPARERGKGFGARLFGHALQTLEERGMSSQWLTASPLGRPLYERRGFRVVDRVERWTLRLEGSWDAAACDGAGEDELLRGDREAWGESRSALLMALSRKGRVIAFGGTVALLQDGGGVQILGPWCSREGCPRENRRILLAALSLARPGDELVADVLASSPVAPLLTAAGFIRTGETDLMVRGASEGLDLSRVVALASLGSMG